MDASKRPSPWSVSAKCHFQYSFRPLTRHLYDRVGRFKWVTTTLDLQSLCVQHNEVCQFVFEAAIAPVKLEKHFGAPQSSVNYLVTVGSLSENCLCRHYVVRLGGSSGKFEKIILFSEFMFKFNTRADEYYSSRCQRRCLGLFVLQSSFRAIVVLRQVCVSSRSVGVRVWKVCQSIKSCRFH